MRGSQGVHTCSSSHRWLEGNIHMITSTIVHLLSSLYLFWTPSALSNPGHEAHRQGCLGSKSLHAREASATAFRGLLGDRRGDDEWPYTLRVM